MIAVCDDLQLFLGVSESIGLVTKKTKTIDREAITIYWRIVSLITGLYRTRLGLLSELKHAVTICMAESSAQL